MGGLYVNEISIIGLYYRIFGVFTDVVCLCRFCGKWDEIVKYYVRGFRDSVLFFILISLFIFLL